MEPMIYKPSIYKGVGVYNIGAGGGGGEPIVPEDYKELLYVIFNAQSSTFVLYNGLSIGSASDEKKISTDDIIEGLVEYPIISPPGGFESDVFFGTQYTGTNQRNATIRFSSSNIRFYAANDSGSYDVDASYPNPQFVHYKQSRTNTIINDTYTINHTPATTNQNARISSIMGGVTANVKFFYLKAYKENGDIINLFKPVVRKLDNVAGIYDLITERFFTSSVITAGIPL